jgi:hypothetical protein
MGDAIGLVDLKSPTPQGILRLGARGSGLCQVGKSEHLRWGEIFSVGLKILGNHWKMGMENQHIYPIGFFLGKIINGDIGTSSVI